MTKAILPYRHTWVSQGMNGAYSHKGTKAIDFGSLKAYQDYNLYAPFDGTVVWADAISKGGAIAFQSDEPVEYADGTIEYMTVITGHDNNRPVAGTKFKKGQLYSHQGTAGGVSKHSHLEVQRGKFVKPTKTIPQQYGNVYYFENTIEPNKALFITTDTIIRSVSEGSVAEYDWKVENDMSLIKIAKDSAYEWKWSVDGNQYGKEYDKTTQYGFADVDLQKEGWERVLKVNGSLFYSYENDTYACGLEKVFGENHQDVEMTAVSDYNSCMAIAGVGDELWYGRQSWIIANKLEQSYCAITGLGLIVGGKKCENTYHKGFETQWNQVSGRTIIGEDKQGNILSLSFAGETGKSGLTGYQCQTEALNNGFYNAIMLDGGGSVFREYNGKYDISTSRKVKNALMLYKRKKTEQTTANDKTAENSGIEVEDLKNQIIKLQEALKEKDQINIELQTKCSNLQIDLSTLEGDYNVLQSKYSQLQKEHDTSLETLDTIRELIK